MHLRNALWRDAFVMYYLTFLLPEVAELLAQHGFSLTVHEDLFAPPYRHMKLVIATRIQDNATAK